MQVQRQPFVPKKALAINFQSNNDMNICKELTYLTAFLMVFLPITIYPQLQAKLESGCLVDGENHFRIENYEKIMKENPGTIFVLDIAGKEFPLTQNDESSRLTVKLNPKEVETFNFFSVVSAKIFGKTQRKVTLGSEYPIVLSDIRQIDWKLLSNPENIHVSSYLQISIQNKSQLGFLATRCLESVAYTDVKGVSRVFDRSSLNGIQEVRNGIARVSVDFRGLTSGLGKLVIKHFGNKETQEIPLYLYEKPPPGDIKIYLLKTKKVGAIIGNHFQNAGSPGSSTITYCPKGYFKGKTKGEWENGLSVCKERRVSFSNNQRTFVDDERTDEMIANSDDTAIFNLKLQDGRIFRYLFELVVEK